MSVLRLFSDFRRVSSDASRPRLCKVQATPGGWNAIFWAMAGENINRNVNETAAFKRRAGKRAAAKPLTASRSYCPNKAVIT
jgi:hypothetical protein